MGESVARGLSANPSGSPEQELCCVLHWFGSWSPCQRRVFVGELVKRAVPGKVCCLLEGLSGLALTDRPPTLFQCQLRLWARWFDSWTEDQQNQLVSRLEESAPQYAAQFYRELASTAGRQ
ncbi:hypothetical protein chiPu_0025402 [Chiloscyllium punctatum]|uniref:Uncharacterized protein n=2 Tax=Chiloscyllium punctatum TaxID=137246 RepID=A0A401TEW6_CHIPU|nr:hypothetical protein [Chiloscyllium punctatum]